MKFDFPMKKIKLSPAFTLGKPEKHKQITKTQYVIHDDDWEIASNSDIQNYVAD